MAPDEEALQPLKSGAPGSQLRPSPHWLLRGAILTGVTGLALILFASLGPHRRSGGAVEDVDGLGGAAEMWSLFPNRAHHECRARLERLNRLHAGQMKLKAGSTNDPDFPPAMESIGELGLCGDKAQGISEDCRMYNHWTRMQIVAQRYFHTFSVFKTGGIQYRDIGQGSLGSCYFLAALASIAYSVPHLVEELFVRPERWSDNIFTTRWFVNDADTFIEVDSMLPASEDDIAFFVQPSSTGEFWPAILEKAWAKIHTSFKAIEGGWWPMPVMAMTRAPVRTSYHQHDSSLTTEVRNWLLGYTKTKAPELWDKLVHATEHRHPMGTSTSGRLAEAKKYGLPGHHAFSVFRAYESPEYGKVVEVFNPWNSDNYTGRIPNPSREDGLFTMGFDEYFDAFYLTYFAEVISGYKPSVRHIQHGEATKWSHHNFEVKSVAEGHPFFVTLNWPGHRLVKPCPMLNPDVKLQVVRADANGERTSKVFRGWRDGTVINAITAEVTSGPGSYHVVAEAEFDDSVFINDLYLSVYAPEEVKITEITGITEGDRFAFKLWGPCIAHWVNGDLWMRSETTVSTNGTKIWKTLEGEGADLLNGKPVKAYWEHRQGVTVQMVDNGRIVAQLADGPEYFERLEQKPIPGSEDWWTCMHENMYTCGDACCCAGMKWNSRKEKCRPI